MVSPHGRRPALSRVAAAQSAAAPSSLRLPVVAGLQLDAYAPFDLDLSTRRSDQPTRDCTDSHNLLLTRFAPHPWTAIGLYDCSGCTAYGLGFALGLDDRETSRGVVDFIGNLTAADVLCGEMSNLYTYDTIVARHRAGELTAQRASWRTELAFAFGTVVGAAAVAVGVVIRVWQKRSRFRRMHDDEGRQ